MGVEASSFVGNIPKFYNEGLGPNIFNHYADDISSIAAQSKPASLLELAAGTGIVTSKLKTKLPPSSNILATDLNLAMLDIARDELKEMEGISYKQADAMELPFEDGCFDAIVCQFGIMFFPDKGKSFKEAHRVLKKGGDYIFNVWGPWATNPFAQIAHETIATFFPDNPPGFYKVPFGYHDVELIKGLIKDAGFDEVKATHLPHTSTIKNIPDFAKALVYGNPIVAEVKERNGNPDEVVEKIKTQLMRNFGATGTMPLEAIRFDAKK